jgi:cytochrome c peroxidase
MAVYRWVVRALGLLGLLSAVTSAACTGRAAATEKETPGARRLEALTREPLSPLPQLPKLDPRVVALGRKLFHEKRLSSDGTVACVSCHDLANGGADGQRVSHGVRGRTGNVNAPTVFNAALNFALFWDGRAKTLEEQAGGPLTNPLEMNSVWEDVVVKLRRDPEYASSFAGVFSSGVTPENVRKAIAAFERTLLTRDSPFDRWLSGDASALTADQREGYETFKSVGCIACHQGANVGGNMFQRFGVLGDYFNDRGNITEADYGRFNVTHNEADRFVFRVPSLRNVEYTAPYFHDGSAASLSRAVQVMAKYQLGRSLTDRQVSVIAAFLKSLSGPMALADNR